MGRQINFYYNRELQKEFFEYVNSLQANIVIKKKGEGLECVKEIQVIEKDINECYITMKELNSIKYKILKNNVISLNEQDELVIEYTCSLNDLTKDKNVVSCRLYYQKYYYEGDTVMTKPESLEKLYEKLVRWIRKHCPSVKHKVSNRIYTKYMSPDVKEKMKGIFNFI